MVKIVAISGSLRKASVNTAVLKAASALAPADVRIHLFGGLGRIPPFNPDIDIDGAAPESVSTFREAVDMAHGVIIASPEYASGVSGVLKNALDWLVSCNLAFYGKPVALLNTSPRTSVAYNALKQTIRTMAGNVIEEASVLIPLPSMSITYDQIMAHQLLCAKIRSCTQAFRDALVAMHPELAHAADAGDGERGAVGMPAAS
ncbi:MAG TPA: NADPH-dependent FMN reductase [Spirochaetia bacterium]|nr:NADPH-dependent FMN reductase [Spirochaetia bacterium]